MSWKIRIPTKVGKQIIKLPKTAQAAMLLLIRDLEKNGPATSGGWKNYGKLKGMVIPPFLTEAKSRGLGS